MPNTITAINDLESGDLFSFTGDTEHVYVFHRLDDFEPAFVFYTDGSTLKHFAYSHHVGSSVETI